MIYPWHQSQWLQLTEHWQNQPHACLITGQANIGKVSFARHMAQALLCEMPLSDHQPCQQCPSCHLFNQNSHPDFYEITPELPETETASRKLLQIKIDAIRNLIDNIQLTSVRGGKRVVMIVPAESMNLQAANSLLKILEEPPADVIFLLITHSKDKLLATIKSRCRQMPLPTPAHTEALQYLQQHQIDDPEALLAFHNGVPLFKEALQQDEYRIQLLDLLSSPRLLVILDYATLFNKQKWPLATFLDWLHKWLLDISLAQQNVPPLYYPRYANVLKKIGSKTHPFSLFKLIDNLNQLTPYGYHTLSVRMQIEFLLIQYLNFWQNK